MFDMGFIKDLRYILRQLPPFEQRQTMLFSATLSPRVMELAYEFMNLAERVRIEPEQVTAERVEQILYHVSRREKFPLLLGLLRQEKTESRVLRLRQYQAGSRTPGRPAERQRLQGRGDFRRHPPEQANAHPRRFQGGAAEFSGRDGRGLPRPAHRWRHPCHQLRPAAGCRGLRPPHRPYRPSRRGREGDQLRRRGYWSFNLPDIEEYIGRKIPSAFPEEEDFFWDYKRSAPRKKAPVPEKIAAGEKRGKRRPPRRKKPDTVAPDLAGKK